MTLPSTDLVDIQSNVTELRKAVKQLTDPRKQSFLKALTEHGTYEIASRIAGVDPATTRRWRSEDARFARLAMLARGLSQSKALKGIFQAGEKDWKAYAWYLSHAPDTREEWGDERQHQPMVTFNIGINRDEVVIQGETVKE